MAPTERKTAARSAAETMFSEHSDVVRESVAFMVSELIEAEVCQLIGVELGERTIDRSTHRNGYRHRRWDTRAGTIDVAVPKLRQGSYLPSILEPRKRYEQALVSVVREAYVNGVSTQKVDRLVEQMGFKACPRTGSAGCAPAWTSRSPRSEIARCMAGIRICGWTRRSNVSASRAVCVRRRS